MLMHKKIWFGMLTLLLPSTLGWAAVVPSLGGQTQQEAQAALEAASLNVGTISGKLMALIPAGIVVDQQPPTGSPVPDGSAVDLVVALPVPLVGQLMPDSWAGQWDLRLTFRNLSTNSIVAEEIMTETICPGDPFGVSLLAPLANCSGVVSEELLDVLCEARFILEACSLDVSVQFTGDRTGDSLSGEGQWTTIGTGDCSGLPAHQPADQGEAIAVVGTRLSTDLDACGTAPASLLQKFVSGTHPSLTHQEELVADDNDGDGVPNNEDACQHSNLGPSVVIDACDSRAANHLGNDGCTISDYVEECAAGATKHRKFVRCVSHLTNDLKKDGIITGKEKGKILSCAARYDDDD